MSDQNRRGRFRVEYPHDGCPSLMLGDRASEVVECSESGLRYRLRGGERAPASGTEVRGVVRFHDGREVDVSGRVVRADRSTVALRLEDPGIPFAVILAEQHQLRRNFLRHLQE